MSGEGEGGELLHDGLLLSLEVETAMLLKTRLAAFRLAAFCFPQVV
jgi:hypothetical protein